MRSEKRTCNNKKKNDKNRKEILIPKRIVTYEATFIVNNKNRSSSVSYIFLTLFFVNSIINCVTCFFYSTELVTITTQ